MANLSKTTKNHDEIQKWAEERGGKPSHVKSTSSEDEVGILRIDFPGFSGAGSLEEISWEDFFEKFDAQNLALVYQEQTADGERSNFNKLIKADSVDLDEDDDEEEDDEDEDEEPASKSKTSARKTAPRTVPAKKAVKKGSVPAKKAVKATAKKGSVPSKQAARKGSVPKKAAPAAKKTPAKKVPAKKIPAKKLPAKKVPAKKVTAKKAVAKKRR